MFKRNILRLLLIGILLQACAWARPKATAETTSPTNNNPPGNSTPASPPSPTDIVVPVERLAAARASVKHIVIIMQENRSFDHYFGTYPGADGIPMQNGVPSVCVKGPQKQCLKPFHNPNDVNYGGPHTSQAATMDIDNGKMDGFVKTAQQGYLVGYLPCKTNPNIPNCSTDPKGLRILVEYD